MTAYYNEHDAQKAAWLRELIRRDLIAPGHVDERSIEEVQPNDLRGFAQCHFFAGIGVWSYALRNAGWPDDAPVWTGSCPCQSFSQSGQRGGFDDPRHLWPAWFRLISERRPHVVFGEQVASPDGLAWLDVVSADVEGAGYAIGAADICAAGVGAPHIRQRLYFAAELGNTNGARLEKHEQPSDVLARTEQRCAVGLLEHTASNGHPQRRREPSAGPNEGSSRSPQHGPGPAGVVEHAESERCGETRGEHRGRSEERAGDASESHGMGDTEGGGRRERRDAPFEGSGGHAHRAVLAGFWADAEWLPCRDGKARPVEPGLEPLAYGAPARVVRLRGYGDGIVAPQATAFVEAYLEIRGGLVA